MSAMSTALPRRHQLLEGPFDQRTAFHLLSRTVIPRPIAWVTTASSEGQLNLAPFSFYTAISTDPPMVILSLEDGPDGLEKDTLRNIRSLREFVVNFASSADIEDVSLTSRDHGPDEDEASIYGVELSPSSRVRPPRISRSAISLECRLVQELHPGSDHLVLGEVIAAHLAEDVLDSSGRLDLARLEPAARVGHLFATLTELRPGS